MKDVTPIDFDSLPMLLSVAEVAALLRMHPRSVQIKARNGEIPAKKIADKWRFSKQRIAEYAGL